MPYTRRYFTTALAGAGPGVTFSPDLFAQSGAFPHGVASGDPLTDRVVVWTRVTIPNPGEFVTVEWDMASDPGFNRIVQRGITSTSAAYDYTVKVDVGRLQAGTTYYYRFILRGVGTSPIGRTKTLPLGSVSRLRFAVASCSNYPAGLFNAYRLIAGRADLDFVIHLGDYIYEYGEGTFGSGQTLGRIPSPNREIVTLGDYRMRYAQYRSDLDLQEVHRQHPFIVVWDDHESANDAWRDGAQNHQPDTEGEWAVRKAVATQAWHEWMPVRENPSLGQIYRTFRFESAQHPLARGRTADHDGPVAGPDGRSIQSRSMGRIFGQPQSFSRPPEKRGYRQRRCADRRRSLVVGQRDRPQSILGDGQHAPGGRVRRHVDYLDHGL
jgi:alkaline phosphatase D